MSNCLICGVELTYQKSHKINKKYCSNRCRRQQQYKTSKNNKIPPVILCRNCFNFVEPRQTKWCKKCAKVIPSYKHNDDDVIRRRREYLALMACQEYLSKSQLIKLLALAEYFGRDLEEWINENEHTRTLMESLERERSRWDELNEKTKVSK